MTIIEKPEYFKKYRDKNGVCISLGDVVFGEDGKAFEVNEVSYKKGATYPICAKRLEYALQPKLFDNNEYHLKPKWLTHEPVGDTSDFLSWLDDLQEIICQAYKDKKAVFSAVSFVQAKQVELKDKMFNVSAR